MTDKFIDQGLGHLLDHDHELVDLPNGALVLVDLSEYRREGLGKALLRVIRFRFEDKRDGKSGKFDGQFGAKGASVCADSTRDIMVYADMNPVVVGLDNAEIRTNAPQHLSQRLYAEQLFPFELHTLALLRSTDYPNYDDLIAFVKHYHERASWIESHPMDVTFDNLAAGERPF
jgi:hypothetical protein